MPNSLRAAFCAMLAFALGAPASTTFAAGPAQWAEGHVLVKPRTGLPEAKLQNILRKQAARSRRTIGPLDIHIVSVPPNAEDAVVRALSKNPHIEFAEKDGRLPLSETTPNDPKYPDAWHLPIIDAPLAWDNERGGEITAAILDTGVDAYHYELQNKLVDGYNSTDGGSDTSDVHGHGTMVAGVVAAASDNDVGVASVAWNTTLMPVRVTNSTDGYAYYSDIAAGLSWAADNGATVANISYDVTPSASVTNAAEYMVSKGGVVVVAAGNSGSDPGYADNSAMIAVSATNSNDSKTSWSSYGEYVDVAAPGKNIWTTAKGGNYSAPSGTSFASPTTAGVVALIQGANGGLGPSDVESVLESTADDLGLTGRDTYYGHGRVNAAAAVEAALATDATDTQPPMVSIAAPGDGATVDGLVPVDVSASDDTGVARVELHVNGAPYATDNSAPYEFSWDSTTVSNGDATLTAYAYDQADNQASDAVTVTVDNGSDDTTAPTVNITNPSDGATVDKNVKIEARAQDDTEVARLTVSVDGKMLCATDSASIRCGWNTKKAGSGSHTITAQATDAADNSASQSIGVTVSGNSGGGGNNGKGNGKGRFK